MTREELLGWLLEPEGARLTALYEQADRLRRERVGEEVHLRGLIELSNHCIRQCAYCGMRAPNRGMRRYRLTCDEALAAARAAQRFGYGSVVIQAGEDPGLTLDFVSELVKGIRDEIGLAVTLSLGMRSDEELAAWREAGASRYLLRFETSDPALFAAIHPAIPGRPTDRIEHLRRLRRFGYEIGSGVMVGIPGQSYASLADDLFLFQALDLDMIGLGPYLSHPETPLGQGAIAPLPEGVQVPHGAQMVYKALALARLLCPEANIPATTALATLSGADGRELGLARGANVIMPNVTPPQARALYEIYPGKAGKAETAEETFNWLRTRLAALGRSPGHGPGGRHRAD